jgi:CHASE1-domain containing sensor protein
MHWETTFTVAGRLWSLLFRPVPAVQNTYVRHDWSILVGGLLCTLLGAGFFMLKWRS